jgi:dinuclear metal center YbgI/SA1388 family protein
MGLTVNDVIGALDRRYPLHSAEAWDAVGLQVGDLHAPATRVLFTVDVTEAVVDEAIEWGADLIVSHHPLLFEPLATVTSDTARGRIVRRLITSGCAVYAAHTNADKANPGVNDALAQAFGLVNTSPLVPDMTPSLLSLVYYVPVADHERVLSAVFEAGAGHVGDYDHAAFTVAGTGQFRPLPGANPVIGKVGTDEFVDEHRVEVVLPAQMARTVVDALVQTHPYEEVAHHLVAVQSRPSSSGLGRVGDLAEPMTLQAFAAVVAKVLPATQHGVRISGDPDRVVSRIAVCGGSGADLIPVARASGAEVFVTSDLKHHVTLDAAADGGPALVDISHWAGESLWLPRAAELLREDLMNLDRTTVETRVSAIVTDPWTARIGSVQAGGQS